MLQETEGRWGLAGGRSTGCTLGYTLRALAGFSRRYIPCRGHRPGPTNPPRTRGLYTAAHTPTNGARASLRSGVIPKLTYLPLTD